MAYCEKNRKHKKARFYAGTGREMRGKCAGIGRELFPLHHFPYAGICRKRRKGIVYFVAYPDRLAFRYSGEIFLCRHDRFYRSGASKCHCDDVLNRVRLHEVRDVSFLPYPFFYLVVQDRAYFLPCARHPLESGQSDFSGRFSEREYDPFRLRPYFDFHGLASFRLSEHLFRVLSGNIYDCVFVFGDHGISGL